MKSGFDAIAYWVLDYYIAATIVLIVVTVAQRRIAQPARRLALHWGTLVGLALLVVLCILPGWPRLDLTALLRLGSPAQVFIGHHAPIGASTTSSAGPRFWSRLVAWDLGWLRLLAVAVFCFGSATHVLSRCSRRPRRPSGALWCVASPSQFDRRPRETGRQRPLSRAAREPVASHSDRDGSFLA